MASCIPRFHILRFKQLRIEILFDPQVRILWMQRTSCVHYSMPFHVRDLNIFRFWYPRGGLEPVLCGYWGTIKVLGESKVIHRFSTGDIGAPNLHLVQGSSVHKPLVLFSHLWVFYISSKTEGYLFHIYNTSLHLERRDFCF